MKSTPKVAAIHDLSGFGRCALTIVMPVLSAMGVQCCPLPTAYLSTHTGGFPGNTFLDMTDAMSDAMDHWKALDLRFEAVYTGFMGKYQQMALAADFIHAVRDENTIVVVDPVMGDHGKLYRTYTPEMCSAMRRMAQLADVVVPNRTEAAILLDVPYDGMDMSRSGVAETVKRLSMEGRRSVVLTGVGLAEGKTGAACYDRESSEISFVQKDFAGRPFHGTGDLFASVLTGALVKGKSLYAAADQAAEFVRLCVAHTAPQNTAERDGVDFEPMLWHLFERSEL